MRMPAAMVRPILVVLTLVVLCVSIPLLLHTAQPAPKMPRIAYLSPSSHGGQAGGYVDQFEQELSRYGYDAGKNISITYRFAEGHDERLDAFAAELVSDKPDVIITINTSATSAAQRATKTIPIVFVAIGDPVRLGFVQNLARPGGNMTGATNTSSNLNSKRLEVLKDALPELRRVAFLQRTGVANNNFTGADAAAIAAKLGMDAHLYDTAGPDEFESTFAAMEKDGIQAVVERPDSVFFISRTLLLDAARRHHLPLIGESRIFAHDGALLGYGTARNAEFMAAAVAQVNLILNGANPGDIPIDQPMEVGLAVNLRVAKELGVTIPRSLLLRATEVIE